MTPRSRDTARGLAAVASLATLLVAPPVALVRFVGWPLPTAVPSLDEMTTAARGGLDDMVVVKVLAVLAWLVWAQLALAAITEVAALIGGRAPRRAPVLPFVQVGVAKLVAVAALVATGAATSRAEPLPMARLVAAVADPAPVAVPERPLPIHPVEAPSVVANQPPSSSTRVYVVRKHDSWWGIAEEILGSGQRWRELRALNVGRVMPDGAVIEPTTETLQPGWELLVPADASHLAASPNPAEPAAEVTVQHGDNLWDLAVHHLEAVTGHTAGEDQIRSYWVEFIEANRDRLADPDDPNLIYMGQRMLLPRVDGQPPNDPPAAPALPSPAARSPSAPQPPSTNAPPESSPANIPGPTAERDTPAADNAATDQHDRAPIGNLGVAGTLLAVGIAGAVLRRRRRRHLHVPAGRKPPDPPAALDGLRAELAADADTDHADRLRRALRDVAATLADRRADARVRLVQVSDQHVEVLLSEPLVPAAPGWKAQASGSAWVLEGELRASDDDRAVVNPAVVSIGRPDDDTELYLDLEAEGVLALAGDDEAVADTARSWILELATSPLCDGVSVALVGDGPLSAPEESDRFRVAGSWEEIAGDAEAWIEQSTALLAANRWSTPPAGRVRGRRSDDLAPLVLFLQERPDDPRFSALCRAILERQVAAAVVVLGAEVEGATRVEMHAGELRIPNIGLVCRAQAIDAEVAAQVDTLLADAADLPGQLELIPPPTPRLPPRLGSPTDVYEDPPFEILVRFLGEICVIGGTKKLKPKQTAVVAYIALHAPVRSDSVEDALWVTPTASRHKRLANTVSETRTALGASHLPAATDGRYRVGPMVITDLELFDRRLAYAEQQEDKLAIETLQGALELVEGPVFSYRSAERLSYVWVAVGNWHSNWELKVVNAAEDLAQRCLNAGDLDGAIWAAQRGLKASSIEPRLIKVLIRAHLAKGDRMAAKQVVASYQAALEGLDLDDADPDLIEFLEDERRTQAIG